MAESGSNPAYHEHPSFKLGKFIGQGCNFQYVGLSYSVLQTLDTQPTQSGTWKTLSRGIFRRYATHWRGKRPLAWFVCMGVGLFVVLVGALMSISISFNTPTVGLGCHSLLYLLFLVFSTIPWILHVFLPLEIQRHPSAAKILRMMNLFLSFAAVMILIAKMIFQTTGGLNRCLCNASGFARGYGGYVDFDWVFQQDDYGVSRYWISATVLSLLVPIVVCSWALRQWAKSDRLWKEPENRIIRNQSGVLTDWLM